MSILDSSMLSECLLLEEQRETWAVRLCSRVDSLRYRPPSYKLISPHFFGVPPIEARSDSLSSIDSSRRLTLIRLLVMKLGVLLRQMLRWTRLRQ